MSNSIDPDEMAHMSHLIWTYPVCKSLLLSPVVVKELKDGFLKNWLKSSIHSTAKMVDIFFFLILHTDKIHVYPVQKMPGSIVQSISHLTIDPGIAS